MLRFKVFKVGKTFNFLNYNWKTFWQHLNVENLESLLLGTYDL